MAKIVQLSGGPGTGKTFSAKTLDPRTTYYIDADGKGLPWAGWTSDYGADKGKDGKPNYVCQSDPGEIWKIMKGVADNRPEVKVIMVDTINTIMTDKEVSDMKKPGYDKWKDMAIDIYELYRLGRDLRNDLIVVFGAYTKAVTTDDYGTKFITKTNGKKLTDIDLNGKLNYNLYTHIERDGKGNAEYFFITQSDGRTEARSTHGVLDYKIPNDLGMVVEAIRTKDMGLK